jgi:hypothetical protein
MLAAANELRPQIRPTEALPPSVSKKSTQCTPFTSSTASAASSAVCAQQPRHEHSATRGLLRPASTQRVRLRVAHPTIVLPGVVPRITNVSTFVVFDGHCQAVRGVKTKARGSRGVGTNRASAHAGNHYYERKTSKIKGAVNGGRKLLRGSECEE